MAPVEPWERVWIDAENYSQDTHSKINCTACHLGQSPSVRIDDIAGDLEQASLLMNTAHEGMLAHTTDDAQATCGSCHPDVTSSAVNSLHSTLRGYDTAVYSRSTPENHPVIEEMEANHCNSCHATCSDCHVSQPVSVGGGLVEGHVFLDKPSMTRNCTACHGSRVKDEYFGAHEEIPSDVHFKARMHCVDCHSGNQMHGDGLETVADRYDGVREPSCESCHQEQIGIGSGIVQHELHGTEILSCQACHSTTYINCVNCHVEKSEEGIPFFSVEDNFLAFYLGRNTLRSNERPYRFVPVRHVPVDVNSFSYYGENILPNFTGKPTWVYATPHNIQRNTPQTETCTSCHGNNDVFLTGDKLTRYELELEANTTVIVEQAPPLPAGYEQYLTEEERRMLESADIPSTQSESSTAQGDESPFG